LDGFSLPIYSDTHAASWNWVIFANILLGSQGLTWSSTVKMDLVGEKDRGLAMGLNEFAAISPLD
jgi:hypothetical protein